MKKKHRRDIHLLKEGLEGIIGVTQSCRVATVGEKGLNVFYVRDASGNPVDMKIIEALRKFEQPKLLTRVYV